MVSSTFVVEDFETFKQQLLTWASGFGSCSFLDNHHYDSPWHRQECLVAAGEVASCSTGAGSALAQLQDFLDAHRGNWVFGHLGYNLKAETGGGRCAFPDNSGFDDLCFFVPRVVIEASPAAVTIHCRDNQADRILAAVKAQPLRETALPRLACQPRLSREEYLERVEALRRHIRRGDCYEINFCLEYFASARGVDPTALYRQLSSLSPNPFAAYYKSGHSHLACASPERFIQKKGSHILSQPIKGTSPRHPGDQDEDLRSRAQLHQSAKDRSENVMVVDLVRNDLSRVCAPGSVQVEELYGVYAYPQVYQMISTVGGELDPATRFADIVAATFPMGSMTGAPKHRVMELIDRYEPSNRGLFSGAVGYFDPSGDFDFNVVIRSLFYNDLTGYLSFFAGSGITWYSQPELEYEECLLKARAMMRVLGSSNDGVQRQG